MYARVSTIQGAPGKVDDVARQTQEQTLPQLQKIEGFKGFVALGDRQSGKLLGVSFWESEEALRASDETASSARSAAAGAAGGGAAGEAAGGVRRGDRGAAACLRRSGLWRAQRGGGDRRRDSGGRGGVRGPR